MVALVSGTIDRVGGCGGDVVIDRKPIFDAARVYMGGTLSQGQTDALDTLLDGWKPATTFDRAEFMGRYVNTKAAAITDADIMDAVVKLDVSPAHIRMVRAVESGGKSFDNAGRPVILFEPHVFYKRTDGRFGTTPFSYAKWGARPYPTSFDGRWTQMADAAAKDEQAALESASWGLFQIMGYHWHALGYASVQDFCAKMAESEAAHLDAVCRFIIQNNLAPALRRCKAGVPESCRDFAKGYNGAGYARNNYHLKMARAIK